MTAFSQPNRTKSLFAQVDAGRPQSAQQKLGGILGSQSSMQNRTAAQTGENQKVDTAKTDVANNTTTGYTNLGETQKLNTHVVAQQNFTGQSTPVLTTAATPVASNSSTKAVDLTNATNRANTSNQFVTDIFTKKGDALTGTTTQAATKELSDAYGKDTQALTDAQKAATEGHLGELAGPSSYELQQAQMQQVLADRDSNVGKLKALYGTGYDTSKYGALDSNLLQGQFNDAQGQATQNIQDLNNANIGGQKARELYLDQIDTSRGITDKAQVDAQKNLTNLGNKINDLDIKINQATGSAKDKLKNVRKELADQQNSLINGYREQDAKANEVRNKIGADNTRVAQTSDGNRQTPTFAAQQLASREHRIQQVLAGTAPNMSKEESNTFAMNHLKQLRDIQNKPTKTTGIYGR